MLPSGAEADVLQVPGVVSVKDRLTLKFHSNVSVPSDSEIQIRLLNRLLWNPNVEDSGIDVTVDRGTVFCGEQPIHTGKRCWQRRVAYDIQGVVHVSNELVVVPTHTYADKAIAQDIMSALQRSFELDHHRIEVSVDNGRVTLSGRVYDLREVHTAYRIARLPEEYVM
jgi:osmotically-inducible protein OsmY